MSILVTSLWLKSQLAGVGEVSRAHQDLVEPGPCRGDRLRSKPEHPRPRGPHADLGGDFARPPGAAAEQRHHLAPDRVAERLDDRPGRHVRVVSHTYNN